MLSSRSEPNELKSHNKTSHIRSAQTGISYKNKTKKEIKERNEKKTNDK
jgi:hypothetical protein